MINTGCGLWNNSSLTFWSAPVCPPLLWCSPSEMWPGPSLWTAGRSFDLRKHTNQTFYRSNDKTRVLQSYLRLKSQSFSFTWCPDVLTDGGEEVIVSQGGREEETVDEQPPTESHSAFTLRNQTDTHNTTQSWWLLILMRQKSVLRLSSDGF